MTLSSIYIAPPVAAALKNGVPVVALESTVITHGMAYPHNLETATRMEQAVRDAGGVPATIALLAGQIVVGIDQTQLEYLSTSTGARKCSVRDLGVAVGMELDGSTTVAATMFIAHKAGIGVFATGGIGGVHRGHPFDVSADLSELGRTPVTVVSAGPKALLDLPLTFEHLETLGVPVIGYQNSYVAAFYARSSGIMADINAKTPQDVARIVQARRNLGLPGGELVAVPIPAEFELSTEVTEAAITQAQKLADEQGVHGAASTPFMLDQIARLTNGASVKSNMALLLNNAKVATQIAKAMLQDLE
ncbi:MAG TPA: pseudouridine-5'-phosphate glycosidase [Thermoflexales bacterium]|nr:pseudouridine-5'-phosphate glycosidase [Thermoflexales bacterium]HQW34550.1 pseudouridine-5'-phosphate glycosidase [Thermoflexales bacterium]HQZ21986.1 pseudouridine-5'-phosphate glycosidase [Thermoflexales bacterium]HQZ98782.1 pseudouridine-5'-phosphate glycosidase [Thermoflexales bacterium]